MIEANLLAEFYSRGQKLKESEGAFVDKLQILARKVIIKKPDFRVNLNTTLKQHYASQLYVCNSASIAQNLASADAAVFFHRSFAMNWLELLALASVRFPRQAHETRYS